MGRVTALRHELAEAERELLSRVEKEAARLAQAERRAWLEARDACHNFDRIRPFAQRRIAAIRAGADERFTGERVRAEMALRAADEADAAYTVVNFARLIDRLRYLHSEAEREAVVREAAERGGVYTSACGGRHFQEIVR